MSRVDEATSPATAEDLRGVAQLCRQQGHTPFFGPLADRLDALAAIRDSERATREPLDLGSVGWCQSCTKERERVLNYVCLDCRIHYGTATDDERAAYAYANESYLRGYQGGLADAERALRLPTSPEPEETT